jgi:hypothetical protein
MWKKNLTCNQAIEFLRRKRGFIDPNIGFVGQLMSFERKFQAFKKDPISLAQNISPEPGTGWPASAEGTVRFFSFTLQKERIISKTVNIQGAQDA